MAILALLALVAGVISDSDNGRFWAHHALLAGLVASVIVVMLSAAVLNEVLERRNRERWSVLAQFVMFELIRSARMVWFGVLDLSGLSDEHRSLEMSAKVVQDSSRLSAALRNTIAADGGRTRVHREITLLADHADEVLGRWAAVMLNAEMYAEILDRHVELAGDLAWIGGLMDSALPPDDTLRHRRARSSPAVQIEGRLDGGWLADRIVVIAQLAEGLDRGTLELALQIVPVEWWEERLGTTAPS